MNRGAPDIDRQYVEEKKRLEDDLEAWKWCYERFKSKIDKIVEYERKVERLEAELKDREGMLTSGFQAEKNKLTLLMFFLVAASAIFVKITAHSKNAWVFFVAGLVVGIGWAVIFKLLTKSHGPLQD